MDETKDGRIEFEIIEKSLERRQVFGWASVAQDRDGHPVVDLGGDLIPVAELEKAALVDLGENQAADIVLFKRRGDAAPLPAKETAVPEPTTVDLSKIPEDQRPLVEAGL